MDRLRLKFEGGLTRFDRMIVGFQGKEKLSMIFRFGLITKIGKIRRKASLGFCGSVVDSDVS